MQEDLQKNLKESIKHLQIAEHMAYVTFPLVNDKRLLLKVFEEIYKSIVFSVSSMASFEKFEKKEVIVKDRNFWKESSDFIRRQSEISAFLNKSRCNDGKNISIFDYNEDFVMDFLNKYGKNYNFRDDKIKKISEIMEISRKHRESAMEFVRKDKLVIMSNNLNLQSLNIAKIKEYLTLAKELFIRISEKIDYGKTNPNL